VNIIGENLKRIRLLKKLSLRQAGEILNMSAPAVAKYEKGLIKPNSEKIIEFANAYKVKTLDILNVYKPANMQFLSFRKKKRLSGQKLKLLEDLIEEAVSKNLEVLKLNDINNSPVYLKKYNCTSLEEAEKAANDFRKDIKISSRQPISDLINILENLGVVIIQIKNPLHQFDDFDGLSEIVDGIPIVVIQNDILDGARQRFTIAHELGHLVLNFSKTDIDEEKMCNRFASSLLMPKEAVVNEFGLERGKISFFELKAFKNEYKVSFAAIAYRLKDLGIISEYLYKKISILLSQKIGKNDPEPVPRETSFQFKRLVHKLQSSEIISLQKACELLGESVNEYNSEDNNY